jgi:hypothetical protein
MLALTEGDISEREIEKPQSTVSNSGSTAEETKNGVYGFTAPNERGKGASEMPRVPIKVEVVGQLAQRRERVGGEMQ